MGTPHLNDLARERGNLFCAISCDTFRKILCLMMHLFTSHLCDIMPYLPSCPRHQVEDTVTVRPYFFPPKTPPRYFHHQKVLCDDANIYSCIALKIINTPVNRSSSLHQLWVSTGPKWEAPSQYHD